MTNSPDTTNLSNNAPVAHLSDAELINSAFTTIYGMEEPLDDIKSYARALSLMALALSKDASGAVARLANDIEGIVDALEFDRDTIFHALHPNGGVFGTGVYGHGEVEGAAS